MRLLLDTHVLLWWLEGGLRLSDRARALIGCPRNSAFVSAASTWEISIKAALGKLDLEDESFPESLETEDRFAPLPISLAHGAAAGRLPRHHDDPFDRMLIAQARMEDLTLITHDKAFDSYDVRIVWT